MDQASTLSRPPPLSSFIGDSFGDEAASHSAWEPDLRTWRQIQGELATPSRTTPLPTSTAAAGWHCCGCDSDQAVFVSDGVWECLACSGRDFYRPDRMHRRQTSSGTWLYIPASAQGPDADGTTSSSTSSSTSGATPAPRLSRRQRRALRTRAGPPPDSEGHFSETGERAESERFTDDPVVDPRPHRLRHPPAARRGSRTTTSTRSSATRRQCTCSTSASEGQARGPCH